MSHAYNRNKRNVTREDEKGEFVLPWIFYCYCINKTHLSCETTNVGWPTGWRGGYDVATSCQRSHRLVSLRSTHYHSPPLHLQKKQLGPPAKLLSQYRS
jgi:hypothetical protein